jgi:hypothetical protein
MKRSEKKSVKTSRTAQLEAMNKVIKKLENPALMREIVMAEVKFGAGPHAPDTVNIAVALSPDADVVPELVKWFTAPLPEVAVADRLSTVIAATWLVATKHRAARA